LLAIIQAAARAQAEGLLSRQERRVEELELALAEAKGQADRLNE
jgi:hypothetical protein